MPRSSSSAVAPPRDLTPDIAVAYHDAALRNVDMIKAARTLEAVRFAFAERRTGLRGLVALDDQIGLAESRRLRTVLVELRDRMFGTVRDDVLDGLREQFDSGASSAPVEWLQTYAAALSFWRLELCRELTRESFDLGSFPPIAEFARWTDAMLQDRWTHAAPLFHVLAGQEVVDREARAHFLALAAENRLYEHADEKGCFELLEQARELAPASRLVPVVSGEYWLDRDDPDLEQADAEFQRARELDPRSEGWYLMGDIHRREGRLEEAEYAYREAMTRLAGETAPYTRLLSLYDDPNKLADHEPILHKFVDRAAAADRLYAHRAYVAMGDAYERCGRYELAYEWYDRAVGANPAAPGPHEARGYALASESRFEEAEVAFRRSIELAPEAFDGRWGLGWLYERANRFTDAIAVYQECLDLRPAWTARIRARMAAADRALGHLEQAQDALVHLLRETRDDETVLSELHELVDEFSEERNDGEAARRLLLTIREILGPEYEYDFQNRLGAISYWFGEYERAAEEFRRSIEANPDVAITHSNLSDTLREIGDLEGAREELERGFAIDEDVESYNAALGWIENDHGNRFYNDAEYELARERYERAAELRPDDDVIHSNLALTWLNIWRPGERRDALDSAERSQRRALSIDPDNEDHLLQRELIEFERRLHDRYGDEPTIEGLERIIGLTVASDFVARLVEPGTMDLNETTTKVIAQVRERLRSRTSLTAPSFRFSEDDDFISGSYSLDVVERVIAFGNARSDARLFVGEMNDLERLVIQALEAQDPRTGEPAWWVEEQDWSRAEAAGVELWEVVEYPLRHLEELLVAALTESAPASQPAPGGTA